MLRPAAGPAPLHLGQPVQAGQGEVGTRGLSDQLDQVGQIECVEMPAVEQTLSGAGVDEPRRASVPCVVWIRTTP